MWTKNGFLGASWGLLGPRAAPGPLRARSWAPLEPVLGLPWKLWAPLWGQVGLKVASKTGLWGLPEDIVAAMSCWAA